MTSNKSTWLSWSKCSSSQPLANYLLPMYFTTVTCCVDI